MRQVRDEAGRVIGGYHYAPTHDVWVCESIHQLHPHIEHSEVGAERWLRDTDDLCRPRGLWARLKALLLRWSD